MDRSPDQRRLQKRRKIPAGFKFRPKDLELVLYLRRRVHGVYIEEGLFHDVNLYNHHPSKLIELFALWNENKAYLFTPRSRKYPNGSRPCRSADGGFWKASGKNSPVKNTVGEVVGTKRALSFYEGRQATKGTKTNWLMHEYKIDESHRPPDPSNCCTMLDDWVLCVVYLNQKTPKGGDHDEGEDYSKLNTSSPQEEACINVDASSQTNMMADQFHIIDAAAEMESRHRSVKDIVVDEFSTSCGSYGTNTYTPFMSTMDPQGASAPDPVTTMEAQLASFWPLDLSTESFHYDDHQQDYYSGMPFDTMMFDYPVVTPLSTTTISPEVNMEQAPYTSFNPTYAQSTEHPNHPPQGYYDYPVVTPSSDIISSQMGMEQAPYTSCSPSYAQSLEHWNHPTQEYIYVDYPVVTPLNSYIGPQVDVEPESCTICNNLSYEQPYLKHQNEPAQGMEPADPMNGGINSGMSSYPKQWHVPTHTQGLGSFDGGSSSSMLTEQHIFSDNPPPSAPQPSQHYDDDQGYFNMQLHSGDGSMQLNDNQDLSFDDRSGATMNIMRSTTLNSYEPASTPAPQQFQRGDDQNPNVQLDKQSCEAQVGGSGPRTIGSTLDSDVMPSFSDHDQFWINVQNQ